MSKKSVAVRIAGHDYKILSEGDPAALRQIASHVDHAMKRVRERTGTVDTLDIAVLTCLNLAREILTLRDQKNEAVEDDRMRSLIERVEMALGEEAVSLSARHDAGAAEEGAKGASSPRPERTESARTLDLPSVEALRERAADSPDSAEGGADTADGAMPETRVAAGGRERAS